MAVDSTDQRELPSSPRALAPGDVVVSRQAIVDLDQQIRGFELLGRQSEAYSVGEQPRDAVTGSELLTGPVDSIERFVGGAFALLRVDAQVAQEVPSAPPPHIILQPSAPTGPTAEFVSYCQRLSRGGYRIALSLDTVEADPLGQVERLADIISVPVGDLGPQQLTDIAARYRRPGLALLATGVDTAAHIDACRAAGFDYLQGYPVPSPVHTPRRSLKASRLGPMRMAASLLGGSFEVAELESILRIEPAMTYRLLRLAGVGSDSGTRRQVRSIREALVLIGAVRLQSWIALLMLGDVGEEQSGAVGVALARARMCESLIRLEDLRLAPLAFTAGILSSFDLLLGVDLDVIAAELSLEEALREAAFGYDSRVAKIRSDVTEYQRGRISGHRISGLSDAEFDAASLASIRWAEAAAWTFAESA